MRHVTWLKSEIRKKNFHQVQCEGLSAIDWYGLQPTESNPLFTIFSGCPLKHRGHFVKLESGLSLRSWFLLYLQYINQNNCIFCL